MHDVGSSDGPLCKAEIPKVQQKAKIVTKR